MKITRFQFAERKTGWRLEEARFDAFNLLVGVSGAGKTKILDALGRLCRLATESGAEPGEVEWVIAFEQEGQEYRWEGVTARPEGHGGLEGMVSGPAPLEISHEKIVRGEEVLIERNGDVFQFGAMQLPKLPKSDSAILLLRDEDSVRPLFRAFFSGVVFSRAARLKPTRAEGKDVQEITAAVEALQEQVNGGETFDGFRDGMTSLNGRGFLEEPLLIAYMMQRAFPSEYDRVKALFTDIFPSVREIRVAWRNKPKTEGYSYLEFNLQEAGSDVWIPQAEISSGMIRTLAHLFEVTFAPPGTVIVVDEFENSLGINCMPELTRFLRTRTDCQFILTSHHPYVINNIPMATWKLVTRKGGLVRVTSASDIPALRGASHHEAFLRLINLPEFEQGIG